MTSFVPEIDDKFGFEAETDWVKVIEALGKF
jgi:hypothetical protein